MKSRGDWLFLGAVVALAGVLVASRAALGPLDHDEHQFIASGALLARQGLLPYRDYPYFHMPYLVLADALLFHVGGSNCQLLLWARGFSAACGIGTAALIAGTSLRLLRDAAPLRRRVATAAAVFLLVGNPIFAGTTGRSWNHDAAGFLLTAAAVLFLPASRAAGLRIFLIGVLLGLAIGVRLTAAPAVGAFAGWLLVTTDRPLRRRIGLSLSLLLGLFVALAPCIWLWRLAPRGFIFGNFTYPSLNTAYRIANDSMLATTTPVGKVEYFFIRVLIEGACLLCLTAMIAWLRCRSAIRANQPDRQDLQFLLVLTLFLLVGCFAPAPLFLVYFYLPVPILLLWLCRAAAPIVVKGHMVVPIRWATAAIFLVAFALAFRSYRNLLTMLRPSRWTPMVVHEQGLVIRRQLRVGSTNGPVLTLTPIVPLEAGLTIYPELATGPFAFRVASGISPADRLEMKLIGPDDLVRLCHRQRPAAVLSGEGRRATAALLQAAGKGTAVLVLPADPPTDEQSD